MNKQYIEQAAQAIIRIAEIEGLDDAAMLTGAWAAIDRTGMTEPPADLMQAMLEGLAKARLALDDKGQISAAEIESELAF